MIRGNENRDESCDSDYSDYSNTNSEQGREKFRNLLGRGAGRGVNDQAQQHTRLTPQYTRLSAQHTQFGPEHTRLGTQHTRLSPPQKQQQVFEQYRRPETFSYATMQNQRVLRTSTPPPRRSSMRASSIATNVFGKTEYTHDVYGLSRGDRRSSVSRDASFHALCTLHANVFTVLRDFERLTVEQQLRLINRATSCIPRKHVALMILHEMHAEAQLQRAKLKDRQLRQRVCSDVRRNSRQAREHEGSAATGAGVWLNREQNDELRSESRNVFRLTGSTASRSVENVYNELQRFLASYADTCTLSVDRKANKLHHVTQGVHTNCVRTDKMFDEECDMFGYWRCFVADRLHPMLDDLLVADGGAFQRQGTSACGLHDAQEELDRIRFFRRNAGVHCAKARTAEWCLVVAYLGKDESTMDDFGASRMIDVDWKICLSPRMLYGRRDRQKICNSSNNSMEDLSGTIDESGEHDSDDDSVALGLFVDDQQQQVYEQLREYVEHPIHQVAICILNYVVTDGRECWSIWSDILSRALTTYQRFHAYPVKDSLFGLIMMPWASDSRAEETFLGVPAHGGLTKLGGLVDFVRSFRLLMRTTILCGCYGLRRKTKSRLNYTQKHECCLPANSRSVYNEIFMTSKNGHDLMCTMPLNSVCSCFEWLVLFEQTRKLLLLRQTPHGSATATTGDWALRHSDQLAMHIESLRDTIGEKNLQKYRMLSRPAAAIPAKGQPLGRASKPSAERHRKRKRRKERKNAESDDGRSNCSSTGSIDDW